jgi:hypothetical protein
MNVMEFMRWLTSKGIFECSSPLRHTFEPVRGFWSIEGTGINRVIAVFDTSFNELCRVQMIETPSKLEESRKEISKIFEL